MATGARGEIEVFSCVDPVSLIGVISRWFQDVGFAFESYETPAQREDRVEKTITPYSINFL